MLTLQKIKSLQADILWSMEFTKPDSKERTRLRNKMEYLKGIELYLESNPTEVFLLQEKERLTKAINTRRDNFKAWMANQVYMSEKIGLKKYEQQVGIPDLKRELKTINFILD